MKKILLTLLTVVMAVSAWANEGDVAYEFTIAKNTSNTNYASTYNVTIGSYEWNVPGNHYANGQLRLGGKSITAVNRIITGKSAFTDPIKKVTINHSACSSDKLNVNSITLVVASDATFTNVIDEITLTGDEGAAIITKTTETTSIDFKPKTLATWPKGAYYKILFNMTCTDSSNRYITISSIEFIEGEGGTVIQKYQITKNPTTNGSISTKIGGSEVTEAAENATVSLEATPDEGYRFVSWSVTGATPADANAAKTTFTMGTSAVSVGATFEEIPSHNISIPSLTNGSVKATINGEDVTSALEGDVVTISAVANDGYKFSSWDVTGATISNNAPATTTFTMGTSDVTISANFVVSKEIEISLNNAGFGTSYTGSVNKTTIEAAGGSVSQTKNGVTVKYALGTGSNFYISDAQARMYNGNTLTVTAPAGANITSIAFVRPTKDAGTWPTDKITTNPTGYDKVGLVWTGNATSVTFSFTDTHRLAGLLVNIEKSFDLTIGTSNWASMYLDFNAEVPEGTTAYYAAKVEDEIITLKSIDEGEVIPANTGVLVNGTSCTFTESSETPADVTGNLFEGVTVATPCEAKSVWVLNTTATASLGDPVLSLYTGTSLGAHKAYLPVANVPAGAKALKLVIDDDNTVTGINAVSTATANGQAYNLAGQRVAANAKGIVIMNGKKFINK